MSRTYDRRTIIEASRHLDIAVNHHILGRKEVHTNILRHFALSTLKDVEKARSFISLVKSLSNGKKLRR